MLDLKLCEALLNEGAKALEISISPKMRQQLLAYIAMLQKWNRSFNLTAVDKPQEMVQRHLLDSLSILPYLQGSQMIDVGTGAGLPGIPLSIVHQESTFVLLDSNHKKQVFVSQAVKSLSLKNCQCVESRVQTYQPTQKFSTILTRAFAPLSSMIQLTAHLLADDGHFLAMMGKATPELLILPEGYQMAELVMLKVPGEKATRHLAIVAKIGDIGKID